MGLLFMGMSGIVWAQKDLRVMDYVTDHADLLLKKVRTSLNAELRQFDQTTGN